MKEPRVTDSLPPRALGATFPKTSRLLNRHEFDTVFRRKCSAADDRLIVYGIENNLDRPRLGLVVSKKVGNAVVRGRWKRLLREAFRLTQHELPPLDLVLLPRGGVEPVLEPLKFSLGKLAWQVSRRLKRASP